MAKGFGIAGLVIALIAISIPVLGLYISVVAVILATIAALGGDRVFATATPLVAFVNTMFLSPTTWILLGGNDPGANHFITTMLVIIGALPFAGMALNAVGKGSVNRITLASMGSWLRPKINYILGVFVIVVLLWTIWGNGPRMIALVTDAINSVRESKPMETRNSNLPYSDETYAKYGMELFAAQKLIEEIEKLNTHLSLWDTWNIGYEVKEYIRKNPAHGGPVPWNPLSELKRIAEEHNNDGKLDLVKLNALNDALRNVEADPWPAGALGGHPIAEPQQEGE